jgi:Flp pilus assembly pilin Flp
MQAPKAGKESMQTRRPRKLENQSGQTMTEYAVILAFIFLVVVVVIPAFASAISGLFTSVMSGFGG